MAKKYTARIGLKQITEDFATVLLEIATWAAHHSPAELDVEVRSEDRSTRYFGIRGTKVERVNCDRWESERNKQLLDNLMKVLRGKGGRVNLEELDE